VVLSGGWIMLGILLFRFGSINRRRLVNLCRKWRSIGAAQAVTS
jgi:hypothetical protein